MVAAGVILGACASERAITDVSPAEAVRPTFNLFVMTGPHGGYLYGISVMSCSGAVVYWSLGTTGSAAAPPMSITYGDVPKGYTTSVGPLPLSPGCYRVFLTGGPSARFQVERDGRVTAEGTPPAVTP